MNTKELCTCAIEISITKDIESEKIAKKRLLLDAVRATGAIKDALSQITVKATGFDVGGEISIAREKNQVSVVAYFCIGTLNLNDMATGLGYRVI